MEFLLGVLAGPFILFGVLWAGLAWWAWILFLGGFAAVETCVYRDLDEWAFAWLIALSLLIAYILTPDTSVSTWYGEIWSTVKLAFVAILDYVILGMVAAVPLWLWYVRKKLVNLRSELHSYVQSRAETGKLWQNSGWRADSEEDKDTSQLSEEQVQQCRDYKPRKPIPDFLLEDWADYRRDSLNIPDGANRVGNNVGVISSYVFLWPFHYITLFFGDFIAKIPEWFVRYFGKILDTITRLARAGIPSGIDG